MFSKTPTKGSTAIIIGTRHNPQLGSYLNACIIGTVQRVGPKSKLSDRQTVTIKYKDFMANNETKSFDQHGYERKPQDCVYGSCSNHAYFTKEDAINALKHWTDNPNQPEHRRETAQKYIGVIQALAD